MKITKRQLRRIIKEEKARILSESYMKQRFTEMSDEVLAAIEEAPGLSGMDIVATVSGDYPYNSNEMPVDKEEVFTILDVMQEEGEVFFDTQEDAWYIADSPEAQTAMDWDADSGRPAHMRDEDWN
jgi:phage I-like protein